MSCVHMGANIYNKLKRGYMLVLQIQCTIVLLFVHYTSLSSFCEHLVLQTR
jgi:hypothetical protein